MRERQQLLDRLVRGLDEKILSRVCVVFDAADPPRDRPHEMVVEGMQVRYAVEYPEADDLIEALIVENTAPKQLAVVSSDSRVRQAASRRGCTVYESQPWLDDLLDGVVGLAGGRRRRTRQPGSGQPGSGQGRGVELGGDAGERVDEQEVDRWMREFGF